ncbi:alpha,alpha-trehalase treA [Aspergillus melleus]|uniref:alpha,alpha-trehalase treA n=1 Tax=Aspergillus melleus TaxID=138277 RepID=UPI001E8E7606|nr:alpha,alpha-trehalase ath1 [Aspergillus melleus]KAH8433874.1 alpha,alpha-trehalase ath1 [Aspergillus melleus]
MRLKVLGAVLLQSFLSTAAAGSSGKNDRITSALNRHRGGHESPSGTGNATNSYQTRFDGVTWDDNNWILQTTAFDQGRYQARGSVANGYLGISVASLGPFFEIDREDNGNEISGWPLFSRRQSFATIAGFYDSQPTTNSTNFPWLYQYGWDSVISGLPHWAGLILDLGDGNYLDATVDNKTINDFNSAYDFKAGVLTWSYSWAPKSDKGSFDIKYRLFANKLNVTQAVVDMEITPSRNTNATVVNLIDGRSAVRTDFAESGQDDHAIFTAVRPWGISNVTAYVYANLTASAGVDLTTRTAIKDKPYVSANASSIAQGVNVKFAANQTVRVTKFVGAASSDAFENPRKIAKQAVSAALAAGYQKSLQSHVSEWATIMPDSSVDHFVDPKTGKLPQDDHVLDSAIVSVANVYYLLQSTVGKNGIAAVAGAPVNDYSISVGGLTSDSYAGQVFWDADVWMQPGLVASHPEAAQRVTNYRVAKFGQAKENIKTSFAGAKNRTRFEPSTAIYPWTSGRFGNCTATGPCWDYQYHLNGDIGLSMIYEWVASGDTQHFLDEHFPIYDSVATLYSNLVERNGSSWTLTNMTDPDEYANHIDAGGFTMALISETLDNANAFRQQFDMEANETWSEMAQNVLMLQEDGVTLEYTSMNGTAVVKQADIVLITYPLAYDNYSAETALSDLDYYANKQSADGPAMTWAIFSIVANDISPSGCSAYTYHQYSFDPYVRPPFYQMSEQMIDDASINGGTRPAFPFLTGHGGANQVAIFGYLGLRLLPDEAIHIDPNLPPQIPYITYRTFYWRGWPISAASNYTHTTIRRATDTPALKTADPRFANSSIPVHVGLDSPSNTTIHTLPRSAPLTIRNRQIGTIPTVDQNIAQCRPVSSPSDFEAGQFPISAVDGASSTKWQPSSSSLTSLTVTLSLSEHDRVSPAQVQGFYFDWAQTPPVNATVIFHDEIIENPAALFTSSSTSNSTKSYSVVTHLSNIALSKPWLATEDYNQVSIPVGNTTHIELDQPVQTTRFATLLIVGNQGLSASQGEGKEGEKKEEDVGATVAEWAILGPKPKSGKKNAHEHDGAKELERRKLKVKDVAWLERRQRKL